MFPGQRDSAWREGTVIVARKMSTWNFGLKRVGIMFGSLLAEGEVRATVAVAQEYLNRWRVKCASIKVKRIFC